MVEEESLFFFFVDVKGFEKVCLMCFVIFVKFFRFLCSNFF